MTHTNPRLVGSAVLTLVMASLASYGTTVSARVGVSQEVLSTQTHAAAPSKTSTTSAERVAVRLQERIERRFGQKPSLPVLVDAVEARRELLTRAVIVQFQETSPAAGAKPLPTMLASAQRFPTWLTFSLKGKPTFSLDADIVAAELERDHPDGLLTPMHARMTGTHEQWGLQYATMDGAARPGYTYDAKQAASDIVAALEDGKPSVGVETTFENAMVLSDDGRVWELLGSGRSEFATSPSGRKANVRKAINQHLNGALVKPGETFSYNATLGGPVTLSRGWQNSLIIVNGKDLEPAAGGGICQAATTLYRAAVMAGMPIVARKPHSLYVHYYEKFGLGLDATIFPKKQDLSFTNDTGHDILIQAYTVGDEAVVNLFGHDDGRTVVMDGPYMGSNAPADLLVNGRPVRNNEIVWRQTIRKASGEEQTKLIVSAYNAGVPHKSLVAKYANGLGIADLYTTVPLPML